MNNSNLNISNAGVFLIQLFVGVPVTFIVFWIISKIESFIIQDPKVKDDFFYQESLKFHNEDIKNELIENIEIDQEELNKTKEKYTAQLFKPIYTDGTSVADDMMGNADDFILAQQYHKKLKFEQEQQASFVYTITILKEETKNKLNVLFSNIDIDGVVNFINFWNQLIFKALNELNETLTKENMENILQKMDKAININKISNCLFYLPNDLLLGYFKNLYLYECYPLDADLSFLKKSLKNN